MRCGIPLQIEGDTQLPAAIEGDSQIVAEIDAAINIVEGRYQDKTVTPAAEAQVVRADPGYGALSAVTVDAIPSNWGRITWDGSVLTVS